MAKFIKLIKNNKGATAIEYGLIAALIAVACITALTSVGTKLSGKFNTVGSSL
jgi:pilus assembly protein Flp/PilA